MKLYVEYDEAKRDATARLDLPENTPTLGRASQVVIELAARTAHHPECYFHLDIDRPYAEWQVIGDIIWAEQVKIGRQAENAWLAELLFYQKVELVYRPKGA